MDLLNEYPLLAWAFGGAGLVVVGKAIQFIYKIFNKQTPPEPQKTTQNSSFSVSIYGQADQNHLTTHESGETMEEPENLETKKNTTKILFIDDEVKFKVVKILQNAGWLHTKLIKDAKSLDQPEIYESQIIFVDVQGVGVELNFKEEGLGLASALKKKYPNKKIIIYSAEQKGDRFHQALREVDDFLPKDADPYQFQSIVESFA